MKAIDRWETADLDDREFSEAYNDMLNEVSGPVRIGTLEYQASRVLAEVDPIAYSSGFSDWLDSLDDSELGGRYECDECGRRYSEEDEAEECCKEDEEEQEG